MSLDIRKNLFLKDSTPYRHMRPSILGILCFEILLFSCTFLVSGSAFFLLEKVSGNYTHFYFDRENRLLGAPGPYVSWSNGLSLFALLLSSVSSALVSINFIKFFSHIIGKE